MEIKVHLLEDGKMPTYATVGSAAMDLFTANHVEIQPMQSALIRYGICMEIPCGYGGFLYMRSGVSAKNKLIMLNGVGVIDSDYRGELMSYIMNLGDQPFEVHKNMKISQLVISKVYTPTLAEGDLSITLRGVGGFGSTGE